MRRLNTNIINAVNSHENSITVNFKFNGKRYKGHKGESLASALIANDIAIVGRSFKFSRPRGIVGHWSEEPNAIVQVGSGAGTVPNLKATQVELYEGLEAKSVNGWPNVNFDLMSISGFFERLMPAGFYYKTFMYPRKFWKTYEKYIRKAAGLGKVPSEPDPDFYEKLNHHCDILVVGAGPSGMLAALQAGRAGARVVIADDQSEIGGSLLYSNSKIKKMSGYAWAKSIENEIRSFKNITVISRCTVFGYYDHNFLTMIERCTDHQSLTSDLGPRQRLHRVRAQSVILATGAFERPLVFANNDLPRIMLASSVSAYINRYAVTPGEKLVVCTNNDNAYKTAFDWKSLINDHVTIIDTRRAVQSEVIERAKAMRIKIIHGHGVIEARGRTRVKSVLVAPLCMSGKEIIGEATEIYCDVVATSGGWSAAVHLSSQTGVKPVWDNEILSFRPGQAVQSQKSVGACNGSFELKECIEDGISVGASEAKRLGFESGKPKQKIDLPETKDEHPTQEVFCLPHFKPLSRAPKQFVDQQLDVTAGSIELTAREGFESVEHVKRYTALGFGTDQGKLSNVNGMAILANALGKSIAETGTTMFRPAYTPTTFGAIAGREVKKLFDPKRYTPMHDWHLENTVEFENVGQWKRPWYFPKSGETMEQSVRRECVAVRNSLGILDASTLGKIDVQGKDAKEFLNRVYTNNFDTLNPGKCRYGLMLKEDGMIFDDGVCACISKDHYLIHTTTGGAANVLAWLELWKQTEWPDLDVFLTSVTDAWATSTISGHNSRKLIQKLCSDIDFNNDNFKFMEWKQGLIAGIEARIFRVSFTGELSFEINVPSNFGLYIWNKLIEAGAEFDITPYGTESMHILRAEKGFIIVGQDTDGSMSPMDMGMDWIVKSKKDYSFLGERSLIRADIVREDRKQFVGLRTLNDKQVLPEGSQIVRSKKQTIPIQMEGHVTSSYFSACLGHPIALAMIKNGHQRMGEIVYSPQSDGSVIELRIVNPVFYDPKGERQYV
ncbi:MAG: sarcosine oxidase subunit alpha family protein [Pseudomonadota bacterium]|nr:sarcosine oxidase subunit alpha family protein [Pseudomonadota bacterium]